MPQIAPDGALNIAALAVDDVYVIIIPPGPGIITGVPTDVAGIIGTATWGPLNAVVSVGSPQEALRLFGPPVATDDHDIATAIAVANLSGASDFRCVRVNHGGAPLKATVNIPNDVAADQISITANYFGALGNNIVLFLKVGSKAGTLRLTVQMDGTGQPKEVYDNLRSDVNFWQDVLDSVGSGQGGLRPPSQLVHVDFIGSPSGNAPTVTPAAPLTFNLTGGTDDNAGVVAADLIGDPDLQTGMYALENSGAFQFILMGNSDTTTWTTMADFALANGMLAIAGYAESTSTSDAITEKNDAGLDTFALLLVKDVIIWDDPHNKVRRAVPPEAKALGDVSILSPEQGVGNRPVFGIVGTERTYIDKLPYTRSEIARLELAGIDFYTNPIPAGHAFGLRHNQNAASQADVSGVNYTRMTNFLAASFANSLGPYIGRVQSSRPNDQLRNDAKSTILAFLNKLKQPPASGGTGMIDDFQLQLDEKNNPPERVAEGFLQADIKVRYLAVVRFFLVRLEGGQTVVVSVSTTPPA